MGLLQFHSLFIGYRESQEAGVSQYMTNVIHIYEECNFLLPMIFL